MLAARVGLEEKVIERITSPEGLERYLSAGGLNKLEQSYGLTGSYGLSRVISLTAGGCGVSFIGVVILGLFAYLGLLVHAVALVVAVLLLAIGLALLIMAFVVFRLSVAWGLVKRGPTGER
jgi:RNA polymerase sigma-70 factor, ECF subfamily